jgi:D-alanyl-D-alanine carboxypeptidase
MEVLFFSKWTAHPKTNYQISIMKKLLILFMCSFTFLVNSQKSHPVFDSLANDLISRTTIPSVVFSYITPDTCLYGIAGINNINDKQKVKLEDKYSLGSNTKAITALIAMKMIEEGQIKLDTRLIDLIPSFEGGINDYYEDITFGSLLSHRAWVKPYMYEDDHNTLPKTFPGKLTNQRNLFTKHVLNQDSVFSLTYSYSNAGYVIASHMMEIAAKTNYEKLVQAFMSEMKYDHYFGLANREDESAPSGHMMENQVWTEIGINHEYSGLPTFMGAAGMLSMNILDYAHLIQMQLNGLKNKNTYISAKSMNTLHYGLDNYAYGWINGEMGGMKYSTHDGSLGINYCHAIILPQIPCAIVIMLNSSLPEHHQSMAELEQNILMKMLR